MTPAARSIVVFGVYLLGVGLIILLAPNILLNMLGLPTTDEPWIRVGGLLVLVLAAYFIACGRSEATVFMRVTVPARLFVAGGLVVLAVLWGYWAMIALAVPDGAGAAWTWWALRDPAKAVTAQVEAH